MVQRTSSGKTPLLESGHKCSAYSRSVYELLRFLLSAARAGVLYETVFIATKSPADIFGQSHASLPQAGPLPPSFAPD